MKIVQDKLRNRQALLVSGLITLIFTSLFLFIIYEQRKATASEGINRLQTRLMDIFNDNELIADAIGERYHHTINGGRCGNKSRFGSARGGGVGNQRRSKADTFGIWSHYR